MQMIVIRHGEAVWNVEGRRIGQLDSPLTERGLAQSRAIAYRLKRLSSDALYSSDLGRALQTAEHISTASGKRVIPCEGLRERHLGVFQGLTGAEIQKKYPKQQTSYDKLGFEDEIPGGESEEQLHARCISTMRKIVEANSQGCVVVVTHGGPLRSFFEYVLGVAPGNGGRFRRPHTAYNAFLYRSGVWWLETWGDTSHLQ